ncbi:MAG TPA: HEAT repeat domain-containing protein [Spirochaetia bacterium]|nr:HEAT repeat domain-containing protein [Spirochaetia bacterium]
MKRYSLLVVCLFLWGGVFSLSAQEVSRLKSFQRVFTIGSIGTKIQVLQDSEAVTDEDMSPLYIQALEFVLDNAAQLQNDVMARELSKIAVRLISKKPDPKAAYYLYRLFESDKNTEVRIAVLNGLSVAALGNQDIIARLNEWLSAQNSIYKSGGTVDRQVIAEAVVTLGKLGDPSSFPYLFSTGVIQYSADISYKVNEALKHISGDYKAMLVDVVRRGTLTDKLFALRTGLAQDSLGIEGKGELTEAALSVGLRTEVKSTEDEEILKTLRYEAVSALAVLKWTKASPLLIEHFDRTYSEYKNGTASKPFLLDAIRALGSVGTHEAARHLTMFLDTLHGSMESGKPPDEEVMLTLIDALKTLGDKIAFDALFYTEYLDYPASVKKAAREALNNLKTF